MRTLRVDVANQQLENTRMAILLTKLLLGMLVGLILAVGGIGIMNVLLAAVSERTREIGIRKAVGARSRDIQAQFLVESVTVTGVGAAIGFVAGLALAFGGTAVFRHWLGSGIYPVVRPATAVLAVVSAVGRGAGVRHVPGAPGGAPVAGGGDRAGVSGGGDRPPPNRLGRPARPPGRPAAVPPTAAWRRAAWPTAAVPVPPRRRRRGRTAAYSANAIAASGTSTPSDAITAATKPTKFRHACRTASAIGLRPGTDDTSGTGSCSVSVSVLVAARVRRKRSRPS
jgi:hypothetical protein